MLEQLVTSLGEALQNFGKGAYLIVSLIVLLETIVVVGQFMPGSVFLAFVGFLCYARVFDFTGMLVATYVSHYAGEMINYTLGRTKGRSLFHEDSRFFKPRFLAMAQERFESGGGRILVVGQFLGFLRPFLALAAGAAHYPLVRFIPVMAFAAFMWSLLPLALGYLCGASWERAVHYLEGLSLFLLVAIPTALLSGWLIRRVMQYSADVGVVLDKTAVRIRRGRRYQRLSTRHPGVFRFLEARLSLSRPWGMHATLGMLGVGVLLFIVAAILLDIRSGDNWGPVDLSTLNLLAQLRNPRADYIFTVITHLGSAAVVWPVVVLACGICIWAKQYKSGVVILASVLLSILLSQVLKFSYGRERPDITLRVLHASGYSFPSGHASVAFGLFGALYYWLWNHPGIFKLRATLGFFVLLLAMLIGFSRLYLGVHYPSDITAGFCVGLASVMAAVVVVNNLPRLIDIPRRADLAALGVLSIHVLVAVIYSESHAPQAPEFLEKEEVTVTTREQMVRELPGAAVTLFGENVLPINLVMPGSADELVHQLQKNDWRQVRPSDFFTRRISQPVFPAFINSKPPQISYELAGERTRLVLRMWETELRYGNEGVWVGSVVRENLRPRWREFQVYYVQPDIDEALDTFASEVTGFSIEQVPKFRERGLFQWRYPYFTHGGALLLTAPDDAATSPSANRVDTLPANSGL